MSLVWFFVFSCMLSVVLVLLACYYFSRPDGDGYLVNRYSKFEVIKVLLGCLFWWITVIVCVNRVVNAVVKPVKVVSEFLAGDLGVKNESK